MGNLEMKFDEYIPLRDIVFKTLREAIITGNLKPGERLMEIRLANELGVSRTPVREAIKKLEQEGLVVMRARKGAVVAPINEKDVREVLEIRKALESLACRLACSKAGADKIRQLRSINKVIARAVKDEDIILISEKDVEFHDVINSMTENEHLVSILKTIKEHIFRYRLEFIKDMPDRNVIVEEHNRIIDAIAAMDVDTAELEIGKHIDSQENYIIMTLDKER